jgi:hypothetical protein
VENTEQRLGGGRRPARARGKAGNIGAKIPVHFGEEEVLVPFLVIDLLKGLLQNH